MPVRIPTGKILHPWELGKALAAPVLYVMGGIVLLLAMGYLMMGLDPVWPVQQFLSGSSVSVQPLVSLIVVVWTFYCIAYLLLTSHTAGLWLMESSPARRLRAWMHQLPSSLNGQAPGFLPGTETASQVAMLRTGSVRRPTAGWAPGFSQQVE